MVENTFDRLTKRLNEKAERKEFARQESESFKKDSPISNTPDVNAKKDIYRSTITLPGGREISLYQTYIDPATCRVWDGNNRLEETRNDHSLEELKNTIEVQGQLVPGFVREIKDDKYQYEVIYGSRRFTACTALGKKFLAQVGDLTDKEALVLMDAENNARKDLSVFEKAISYQKWLEKGMFKDRADLAAHLGITVGWLSKMQAILKLPNEVLEAFNSKTEIKIWWAMELLKIIKTGDSQKACLIEAALKKPVKTNDPEAVYKYLVGYSSLPKKKASSKKNVKSDTVKIKNNLGKTICDISLENNGKVKIIFTKGVAMEDIIKKIEKLYIEDKSWEF
jgi:ParB/RepB/Spo0J family partition protein